MEGNTKAIYKTNTYLKNYCDDTTDHYYDDMVNGYDGGDGCHYSADSMLYLGNGFAEIILNNNMLDF